MNFQAWWDAEGVHLEHNTRDLAKAAFEAGGQRHAPKIEACIGTLNEMRTIIDNTPLNECKTEVIFADVRKQNQAMDDIHELVLQLLDACKARD